MKENTINNPDKRATDTTEDTKKQMGWFEKAMNAASKEANKPGNIYSSVRRPVSPE